jgi:predicted phosphodiesterase
MKIAVLSDIHGNLPALQAVADHLARWQPDQVIVNGDTVNRGPASLAAWQFVQQQTGWQLLKGNHEDYVIGHKTEDVQARNGRLFDINYMSYWTYLQHKGEVAELAQLADGLSLFAPDGSELRLRHASMKHNRDGIWPHSDPEAMQRQIGAPPAVFATAHIHSPFVRQVGSTIVVNSGSVGTPADGDPRASYAQIRWQRGYWSAQIIRLAYDRTCTRQHYQDSGFLADAGLIGWLVFHEWEQARSIIYAWLMAYYEAVLAGEIELETAVRCYLSAEGLAIPLG